MAITGQVGTGGVWLLRTPAYWEASASPCTRTRCEKRVVEQEWGLLGYSCLLLRVLGLCEYHRAAEDRCLLEALEKALEVQAVPRCHEITIEQLPFLPQQLPQELPFTGPAQSHLSACTMCRARPVWRLIEPPAGRPRLGSLQMHAYSTISRLQVPRPMIGTDAFQETPIVEVTRQITKHNYLVMDIADLPRVMKEVG